MTATSEHEAGHLWVAHRLGWWAYATIRGGQHSDGCTRFAASMPVPAPSRLPLVLRPAGERAYLEGNALLTLAGDVAEEILAGRSDDPAGEPLAALAVDLLAEAVPEDPPVVEQERAWAAEHVDGQAATRDDVAWAEELARLAHGDDRASAACWLATLESQARWIIAEDAEAVALVARLLDERGELTTADIAAVRESARCAAG